MAGARARQLNLSGLISLGGQANSIKAASGRSALGEGLATLAAGLQRTADARDRKREFDANEALQRDRMTEQARQFDASQALQRDQMTAVQGRFDKEFGLRTEEHKSRAEQQRINEKIALLRIANDERAPLVESVKKLSMWKQQFPVEFANTPGLEAELQTQAANLRTLEGKRSAIITDVGLQINPSTLPEIAVNERLSFPPTTGETSPEAEYAAIQAEIQKASDLYAKAEVANDAYGMAVAERVMRKNSARAVAVSQQLHEQKLSMVETNLVSGAVMQAHLAGAKIDEQMVETVTGYVRGTLVALRMAGVKIGEKELLQIQQEAVAEIKLSQGIGKAKGSGSGDDTAKGENDALIAFRTANNVDWTPPVGSAKGGLGSQKEGYKPGKDTGFVPPGEDPRDTRLIEALKQMEYEKPGSLEQIRKSPMSSGAEAAAASYALEQIDNITKAGERAMKSAPSDSPETVEKVGKIKSAWERGVIEQDSAIRILKKMKPNASPKEFEAWLTKVLGMADEANTLGDFDGTR